MSEHRVVGAHVKIAFDDLTSARNLFVTNDKDRNVAQMLFQAAENLTMAALTSEGIDVTALRREIGNHQLGRMVRRIPDACTVKQTLDDVSILEQYATTYRYPSPSGKVQDPPLPEDARALLDQLVKLLDRFCKHFQVNPREASPRARSITPFR